MFLKKKDIKYLERKIDELHERINKLGNIMPLPAPILFDTLCCRCNCVTTHRSYLPDKTKPFVLMTTTSAMPMHTKQLIRVCLTCGLETYED